MVIEDAIALAVDFSIHADMSSGPFALAISRDLSSPIDFILSAQNVRQTFRVLASRCCRDGIIGHVKTTGEKSLNALPFWRSELQGIPLCINLLTDMSFLLRVLMVFQKSLELCGLRFLKNLVLASLYWEITLFQARLYWDL